MRGNLLRNWSVQSPCIGESNVGVRAQNQAAVEAAKAMTLLKLNSAPVHAIAVDPVESATRIGDANRELIRLSRLGSLGQVAFKWEFLHDGVTHQLAIQIDFRALPRATDVQENKLFRKRCRDLNISPPP